MKRFCCIDPFWILSFICKLYLHLHCTMCTIRSFRKNAMGVRFLNQNDKINFKSMTKTWNQYLIFKLLERVYDKTSHKSWETWYFIFYEYGAVEHS